MNYTGVYAINKYIFLWHEDVILTINIYVHCIHDVNNSGFIIIIIINNNIFIIIFIFWCFDGWKVDLICQPPILIRKHLLSLLR